MAMSERLNSPVSSAELERRWRAVRAAMAKEKIDVLLMQNNNDHMGGYVRYFTDMPATNGYPNTVIFPREDEMTVVCQGPFGGSEATAQGDQNWRGVKRILTTPSYASTHYTKDYDPELAASALKPFAQETIGYVGTYQMSYALLDHIKRARQSGSIDSSLLSLGAALTDANAAVFDAANAFRGCIPGIHEVLRRDGLLDGIWCLNPNETLSPGQGENITRVTRGYPELTDRR